MDHLVLTGWEAPEWKKLLITVNSKAATANEKSSKWPRASACDDPYRFSVLSCYGESASSLSLPILAGGDEYVSAC